MQLKHYLIEESGSYRLEIKSAENNALHFYDLLDWNFLMHYFLINCSQSEGIYFLHFRRNQHTNNSNNMKFLHRNSHALLGKVAVHDLYSSEKRL